MKEKTFPRVKNLFTRGDTQCLDTRYLEGGECAEWLIIYNVHRDSHAIEQINFDCMKEQLEEYSVLRMGHWAVGFVEYLLIPPGGADEALALKLRAKLDDYPVLDDSRLDTCEGCGEDYDRKSRGDNVLTGCCSEDCEHMLDEREHCAHCGEFCHEERHGMDGVYCSKWCFEAAEGVDDDA